MSHGPENCLKLLICRVWHSSLNSGTVLAHCVANKLRVVNSKDLRAIVKLELVWLSLMTLLEFWYD